MNIFQINFTEEEAVEIPRDLRLSMRVGIHSEDTNMYDLLLF